MVRAACPESAWAVGEAAACLWLTWEDSSLVSELTLRGMLPDRVRCKVVFLEAPPLRLLLQLTSRVILLKHKPFLSLYKALL